MARHKTCAGCGALNQAEASFCGRCGASLSAAMPQRQAWLYVLGTIAILSLAGAGFLLLTDPAAWFDQLLREPDREISAAEQPSTTETPTRTTATETMAPASNDQEISSPTAEDEALLTATASAIPSKTASPTPVATATPTPSPAPSPTVTAPPSPTPTAGPLFTEIIFCVDECRADGANAQTTFPGGITRLNVRWTDEELAIGAQYERLWYNNDRLWAHYECTWPGPTAGVDLITLTDPDGLHSGIWEMQIVIDGQLSARQQITLTGDHVSWDPPGRFDSCYGKK